MTDNGYSCPLWHAAAQVPLEVFNSCATEQHTYRNNFHFSGFKNNNLAFSMALNVASSISIPLKLEITQA
eukprot:5703658-Karenia_brevis.AAC.1